MTQAWRQWEGQVVNGEFHLRRYLGGSDRSAVFLTEYGEREPEKAAIKLISADAENTEVQLTQWRLAAKLSHPHLVRLFQMGRCQLAEMPLIYVVMEYAEEDLSQVLPHRPLTPAEVRDMLRPVLGALAYIHGNGFVHGHLKPANIMAVDDQVKVSSDGLCRMDRRRGNLGSRGVYDPPEAPRENLPAGDIWSLGLTLVEALTQQKPLWRDTEQAEPALPESMPAPFLDVARHCLQRDPQRRLTVADIAARLQQTLPMPEEHTPVRLQEGFPKWRYVIPTIAVGLALAVVLLGPRLVNRAKRAPSLVSEQPTAQPRPEQRPATSGKGQPTQKTPDEKQGSGGTAPPPTGSGAELKTPAGDLVRGEVLQKVLPDVPQKARDTIRGKVRVNVRVTVDPSGGVVAATLDSPGPSKYFANLALQAARRWEFVPAEANGRSIPSEWILRFEFESTTTKVSPVRALP